MFDFVRNHNKLFFFVLVLLIFPSFVFFGLQGYTGMSEGANATVATVDGRKITQAEWDAANRQQVEQIQRSVPGVDPKLLDSPEIKREALERLVRERVLFAASRKQHLTVTDDQLQTELMAIPQLAQLRSPSGGINIDAYKSLLQSQGLTPEVFESSVRQEATLRQALEAAAGPVPNSVAATRLALEALLQRREVQVKTFEAKDYAAKVSPSADDLAAYYKTNQDLFKTPELAVIEYVVLDAEALKTGVSVSADDVRKYYDENLAAFTNAEERQASHILVKADKASATAEQRTAAKAKAEALLAEVRRSPDQFAALAKKNSEDPGSAAQGGDLGFFGRSAMTKPFEDAVYAMKAGEISNVVESEFGYHIIRLQATRGGEKQPFDKVKTKIEDDLKLQLAQKEFTQSSEQFGNLAYEQADTLQPLVDKLKLAKRTATVARAPDSGASGPTASPKLLEAVFATDVLKNKRNTQAIETGRNQLTAARVTDYKEARVLPLEVVNDRVRQGVVEQQAAAMAKKEGEARLAQLKGASAASDMPAAVSLSRAQTQNQPQPVIDAVLRAPSAPLPQWVGVDLGANGFAVARINAVSAPAADSPEVTSLAPRYSEAWAVAQSKGYFEALKKRYGAEILVKFDTNPSVASQTSPPARPSRTNKPMPMAAPSQPK